MFHLANSCTGLIVLASACALAGCGGDDGGDTKDAAVDAAVEVDMSNPPDAQPADAAVECPEPEPAECPEPEPGATLPTRVEWRMDRWLPEEGDAAERLAIPSLSQPFYNDVFDVHATLSAAATRLIFSTNGNWHLSLRRLLAEQYFPANPEVQSSYLLTTSPPISLAQAQTGRVKVGNIMYVDAQPHVMAGPGRTIDALEEGGFTEGERIPIIFTYGNVILKRRGDDRIQSFWDLADIEPGRFASSHPAEGGSYNNYRNSVRDIAINNPRDPGASEEEIAAEADALVARLFDEAGVASIGPPMHRSVPHLIATGEADAGLFFNQLAIVAMRENPDAFTAVYLASDRMGETDDPDVLAEGQMPLAGNRTPTFFVIRSNVELDEEQTAAREAFIEALQSEAFTAILGEEGLRRPE